MKIVLKYRSWDGVRKTGRFKTLDGARAFVRRWVGDQSAEDCLGYAVSADGMGKVVIQEGCTWADLYPTPSADAQTFADYEDACSREAAADADREAEHQAKFEASLTHCERENHLGPVGGHDCPDCEREARAAEPCSVCEALGEPSDHDDCAGAVS